MKYSQFENKFFISVPVKNHTLKNEIDYLDCYVCGYILKKASTINAISHNLQLNKNKLIKILKKLRKYDLIYELNKKIYFNDKQKNLFLFIGKDLVCDITLLPNLDYLSIEENALYWKLYKYADPVKGMMNCYTISSKINVEKINYNYLMKVLGFSSYKLKKCLKKLKKLQLIKIKRSGNSFYFGIQPVKEEMKKFWRDKDNYYETKFFSVEEVFNVLSENLNFRSGSIKK